MAALVAVFALLGSLTAGATLGHVVDDLRTSGTAGTARPAGYHQVIGHHGARIALLSTSAVDRRPLLSLRGGRSLATLVALSVALVLAYASLGDERGIDRRSTQRRHRSPRAPPLS